MAGADSNFSPSRTTWRWRGAPCATCADTGAESLLGVPRQRQVVLDGDKLLSDPAIVVAAEVS